MYHEKTYRCAKSNSSQRNTAVCDLTLLPNLLGVALAKSKVRDDTPRILKVGAIEIIVNCFLVFC